MQKLLYRLVAVNLIFLPDLTAQNIRADTLQLDEVVVSASKFGELKRNVPYQIEQMKRSEIAFRNARLVHAERARFVPANLLSDASGGGREYFGRQLPHLCQRRECGWA